MECLSISLRCLEYLSTVFYSFQSTDLSPLWLSLFLGTIMGFGEIVIGIDSLVSLSVASLLVYRNATNFGTLILYPATLLNSFISSNSFLVESFVFSICGETMSSANSESLTTSLPVWKPFLLVV